MKMYCSCHQCMKESVGDIFLFGEGIGNLAEERICSVEISKDDNFIIKDIKEC